MKKTILVFASLLICEILSSQTAVSIPIPDETIETIMNVNNQSAKPDLIKQRSCNKVCVNGHSMLTCKEGLIWPKENRKRKTLSICC